MAQGMPLPYAKALFNPTVNRLARTSPYYDRNRAHVCSFFVKGTCNRGILCPFRHEKPEDNNELAHQNIKDRYYGVNDPVAKKLLNRASSNEVEKPEDSSITTLYIGNVDRRITEQDLRDHFYFFGEITSILLVAAQRCAFVEFGTRIAAEAAVQKYQNSLIIKGVYLKIAWSKPQDHQSKQPEIIQNPAIASKGSNYYPSMDPERLGSY